MEFQGGNTLQNPDRLSRVLHPGQFHHDPVNALLLHRRFGNTERIYPVQQGSPVSLQRVPLNLQNDIRRQSHVQQKQVIGLPVLKLNFGKIINQLRTSSGALLRTGEPHLKVSIVDQIDAPGSDALLSED